MRPYHGKYLKLKKSVSILLRARVVVKSIFCILTQRVSVVFVMPIAVRVVLADLIVKASCCHHNFLLRNFASMYNATLKLRF